jgi:TolB protein
MRRLLRLVPVLAGLVAGSLALPAIAQMRIDVSGVGATQLPIAIAGFASDSRLPQDVAAVVRSDLARSGAFRVIDPAQTVSDTAPVDFAGLRTRGADTFVDGRQTEAAPGAAEDGRGLHDQQITQDGEE